MEIFRTIQHAFNYFTSAEYREENNRRELIHKSLIDYGFYEKFKQEEQGELLVRILNEIRKEITSTVLDKKTRKHVLLDSVQTETDRLMFYKKIIEDVTQSHIDEQLIANQLVKFDDPREKMVIELLLKNATSKSNSSMSNYSGSMNSLILNVTSNVFKRLLVLDKHVLSIQPMQNPVGSLYRMVQTHNGFEIIKQVIAAATRKFQACINLELACDDMKYHGLDPEIEITNIVSQEVFYEIAAEMLHLLYELASQTNKHVIKHPATKSNYDEHIRTISDSIKSNTGRGLPNFVIVNKLGLAELTRSYNFQPTVDVKNTQVISYVGTVNLEPYGSTQVSVLLAEVAEFTSNAKPILLFGYRGSEAIDAGFFYCPYLLCYYAGITAGELDFQPRLTFATRYAHSSDLSTSDSESVEPGSHFFGIIEGPVEETVVE